MIKQSIIAIVTITSLLLSVEGIARSELSPSKENNLQASQVAITDGYCHSEEHGNHGHHRHDHHH